MLLTETISTILNSFSPTEPIITEGSPEFKVLEDAWTVVSLDNQRCLPCDFWTVGEREGRGTLQCPDSSPVCFRSAQFEHTVLITPRGVEILTKLPQEAWESARRPPRPRGLRKHPQATHKSAVSRRKRREDGLWGLRSNRTALVARKTNLPSWAGGSPFSCPYSAQV
jgi:hypothetical protein